MKKAAIIFMLITMFSKILGFGRDITLSYFFGASNISDAYLISTTIPNSIFSFIGAGIATSFIPIYTKVMQRDGSNAANRFMNNLVNILIIISTLLIILILFFTEEIVKLFASGFNGDTLQLTIELTRLSLMGIYFTGLVYIFSGFLQLKSKYTITALITFPMNIILIFFIYISYYNNILLLSVGTVISIAAQLLLLLPFAYKSGYRYKWVVDFKDKQIKKMAYIALPIIIGVSVNEINVLVDRTLASRIAVGGISALNYSQKITGFVQGIFVMSIVTIMFPVISQFAANEKLNDLKKTVAECINSVNLLVIPATIGIMIFSEPIVKLFFGRGAFDSEALGLTSYSLFFYSMGMLGVGLRQVISKTFYSLGDTKTPMVNATIALLINIILNVILSKYLGIGGIALATSISATICTLLLLISLKKRIGSFGLTEITVSLLKIIISSVLMGIISKIVYTFLIERLNMYLSLFCAVGVALLVYCIRIYVLKVRDAEMFLGVIKAKFGFNRTKN